jgi:ATP-dependent Clp protease adaptor protein ClpS
MPREKKPKEPAAPPSDGTWEREGESDVATEEEQTVERPKMFNVLLHNDNYTTMEFVVMVLVTVFHLAEADAVRIMLNVHNQGIGVAGTYTFEVAETRADKTMRLARQHEFPLKCTVEPI